MSSVKEAVEEAIEESYLLNMTEDQIRMDFKQFIDTCFLVLHSNIRNSDTISELAAELAREKTCALISDHDQDSASSEILTVDSSETAGKVAIAEKVARRKRMIIKAIEEIDPQLIRLIDERRFHGSLPEKSMLRFSIDWDWKRFGLLMLQIGYGATVALIILLIYLGFIQNL